LLTATDDTLQKIIELLDVLQCGAMLIDRGGRIVHANLRLCQLAQRTPAEVHGRRLHEFYPGPQDRAFI